MLQFRIYFDQIKKLNNNKMLSDKLITKWLTKEGVFIDKDNFGEWYADFYAYERLHDKGLINFLTKKHGKNWENFYKPFKQDLESKIQIIHDTSDYSDRAVVTERTKSAMQVNRNLTSEICAVYNESAKEFKEFCKDFETAFGGVKGSTTTGEPAYVILAGLFMDINRIPMIIRLGIKPSKNGRIISKPSAKQIGTMFNELIIRNKIKVDSKQKFAEKLSKRVEIIDYPEKHISPKTLSNGLSENFESQGNLGDNHPFYPIVIKYGKIAPE